MSYRINLIIVIVAIIVSQVNMIPYSEVVIGASGISLPQGVWVTSSGQVYVTSTSYSNPYSSILVYTVSTSSGTFGSSSLIAGGGSASNF